MLAYIVRRLLGMIPTLVVVSILTFVIIHLAPGDFLTTLATQAASSGGSIDQAAMDSLRQRKARSSSGDRPSTSTGCAVSFPEFPSDPGRG